MPVRPSPPARHIAVLGLLAALLALTPTACRPPDSAMPASPQNESFPPALRLAEGALARLPGDTLKARLLTPARDRFDNRFGSTGLLPAAVPEARSAAGKAARSAEHEVRAWLAEPASNTLLLVGQDTVAGDALAARLSHQLAAASLAGKPVAVPLELELASLIGVEPMTSLLSGADPATALSRALLASLAIGRFTGIDVTPGQAEADLNARALLLVVTDFDRMAEMLGPGPAQRLLEALATGPGKLLIHLRPVWLETRLHGEEELIAEGADTRRPAAEARLTTEIFLEPLADPISDPAAGADSSPAAGSGANAAEKPEPDRTAGSIRGRTRRGEPEPEPARPPTLDPTREAARAQGVDPTRDLARQPALAGMVRDVLSDPLTTEALHAAPDLWHLFEVWTRWKLEVFLGEGRLSAVEQVEAALTSFAVRLYRNRVAELPLEAPERVLQEEASARAIIGPDRVLSCEGVACRFNHHLIEDYFVARALRAPIERDTSSKALMSALDGRRPGAGALAFLASGIDDLPGIDERILAGLSGTGGSASTLEGLVRLRLLREGVASADGGLGGDNRSSLMVIRQPRKVQQLWDRLYAEETERVAKTSVAEAGRFLRTRAGKRYKRMSSSSPLLRDRDGSIWAWVPAGQALVGSYLRGDEDPVRRISVREPFLLNIHLVRNDEFQAFVREGRYKPHPPWVQADWARFLADWSPGMDGKPAAWPEGRSDHPVIHVSWEDARAYCAWRARQDRVRVDLPTEEEWEYAARATLGRRYPWGDSFSPDRANTAQGSRWQTTPVGAFAGRGEGPFRSLDMAGNVWQWTASTFERGTRETDRSSRALRGGGWRSEPSEVRSSRRLRGDPMGRYDVVGFRLKRSTR